MSAGRRAHFAAAALQAHPGPAQARESPDRPRALPALPPCVSPPAAALRLPATALRRSATDRRCLRRSTPPGPSQAAARLRGPRADEPRVLAGPLHPAVLPQELAGAPVPRRHCRRSSAPPPPRYLAPLLPRSDPVEERPDPATLTTPASFSPTPAPSPSPPETFRRTSYGVPRNHRSISGGKISTKSSKFPDPHAHVHRLVTLHLYLRFMHIAYQNVHLREYIISSHCIIFI